MGSVEEPQFLHSITLPYHSSKYNLLSIYSMKIAGLKVIKKVLERDKFRQTVSDLPLSTINNYQGDPI